MRKRKIDRFDRASRDRESSLSIAKEAKNRPARSPIYRTSSVPGFRFWLTLPRDLRV
jgi:hypothetical protein